MSNLERYVNRNAMGRFNAGGYGVGAVTPANRPVAASGFSRPARATGMGMAQSNALAPLFGIVITNAATSNVSNVNLFGANTNLYAPQIAGATAAFNSAGALVGSGITIQTLYGATISYLEFLSSTQNQVFNVGAIHMSVTSGTSSQAFNTFTTTQKAQSGALTTTPYTPLLDPASQQAGVSQAYVDFAINGLASMAWSTFFASTSVQISFFPSSTINPSDALSGQAVQRGWNTTL
jgi:hypothetical protein